MELFGEFIQHRVYLIGVSPKTVASYQCAFKAYAGATASKQAIMDRSAQLRAKGVSAISVNCYLRHINAYLNWLHIEKSAEIIKLPKLKEEQKVLATLSKEHLEKLLHFRAGKHWERRTHSLCLLLLDTGLRISEALSLIRANINLDSMCLTVRGKGNKQRVVPISLEGRKVLYRYLVQHNFEFVFCCCNGNRLSVRNASRDIQKFGKKLRISGIRFSPHTFRHSFAVSYLRNGGNLFYLSKILGHTSITTTQRYLQSIQPSDLQSAHNSLSPLSSRK